MVCIFASTAYELFSPNFVFETSPFEHMESKIHAQTTCRNLLYPAHPYSLKKSPVTRKSVISTKPQTQIEISTIYNSGERLARESHTKLECQD